jgi:hypothetical protein
MHFSFCNHNIHGSGVNSVGLIELCIDNSRHFVAEEYIFYSTVQYSTVHTYSTVQSLPGIFFIRCWLDCWVLSVSRHTLITLPKLSGCTHTLVLYKCHMAFYVYTKQHIYRHLGEKHGARFVHTEKKYNN